MGTEGQEARPETEGATEKQGSAEEMTDIQIRDTARKLIPAEVEELLRKAYFSFDANLREHAEKLAAQNLMR